MAKNSWEDDLAGSLVAWIVLFPILLGWLIYQAHQNKKAAEEAAEAARVYRLPDDLIHI